jgi:hypothetical protein
MVKSTVSKKSMIEVQFNWIFVIVAGVVVFLFIMSIVFSEKKQSEEKLNSEFLQKLTSSIRGKQQLTDTYNELSTSNTELSFRCDAEDKTFDFSIAGSNKISLPQEIIFTPEHISGNTFQLWTLDFSVPFTVTRFMFITTPSTVFIIYSDSSTAPFAAALAHDLPSNITKKMASSEADIDAIRANYPSYKIICFVGHCPQNVDKKYDYISINPQSTQGNSADALYAYGNVIFRRGSLKDTSFYVSKSSMFGAIFSDNKKDYECQMSRAMDQFNLKRTLHVNRMDLLAEDPTALRGDCSNILTAARLTMTIDNLGMSNIQQLPGFVKAIETADNDLNFKGCPLIY